MEKKHLILGIFLVILIIAGLMLYFNQYTSEVLQVGEIKYTIRDDYKIDGLNVEGNPTITNGHDYIFLTYYNDTHVEKIVKDYVNERESNNITIIQSNYTLNNLLVYKTYSNQGASHYWFLYGGKTYSIYTWKETTNIDSIVNNLISSLN